MVAIDMLGQIRGLAARALSGLAEEDWWQIPAGFDNNIAWNVGHLIVVQQQLTYGLCGLEMGVTAEDMAQFRTGTSPASWTTKPDPERLRQLLDDLPHIFQTDFAAGLFQTYRPYKTSTGVSLPTLADAISFNNFHEGLHLGTILALKNFAG